MSRRSDRQLAGLIKMSRQENCFDRPKKEGSNNFYEKLEDGFYTPDRSTDSIKDKIGGEKS